MITNPDRADRARAGLAAYVSANGGSSGEEHVDAQDLICDLMHVLRAEGVDPFRYAADAIACFATEDHDPSGLEAGARVSLIVTVRPEGQLLQVVADLS